MQWQCNGFPDGCKVSNGISIIIKRCLLEHIMCKEIQSKPWLCLKMYSLVMPDVGKKIKQVLRSRINILAAPVRQHLQRFESTQPSFYLTFEPSINVIKSACYYSCKSRTGKYVLSSYIVRVGKKEVLLYYLLETQERNTSKKSLDSWTHGHKIRHWDLLAWEQYTQCLRYYYKNEVKHQKVKTIWTICVQLLQCSNKTICTRW